MVDFTPDLQDNSLQNKSIGSKLSHFWDKDALSFPHFFTSNLVN